MCRVPLYRCSGCLRSAFSHQTFTFIYFVMPKNAHSHNLCTVPYQSSVCYASPVVFVTQTPEHVAVLSRLTLLTFCICLSRTACSIQIQKPETCGKVPDVRFCFCVRRTEFSWLAVSVCTVYTALYVSIIFYSVNRVLRAFFFYFYFLLMAKSSARHPLRFAWCGRR